MLILLSIVVSIFKINNLKVFIGGDVDMDKSNFIKSNDFAKS